MKHNIKKRGYKVQNILEYIIIFLQILGFGIITFKIGVFLGKLEDKLSDFDCRITKNENQIRILNNQYKKEV